ncbi:MAG: hypothetical protein ACF8Q5_09975 [Phycisphaerales bacterium JB040]
MRERLLGRAWLVLGVAVIAAPGGCGSEPRVDASGVHGLGRGFASADAGGGAGVVFGADRSTGHEDARNNARLSVGTARPGFAGDAWGRETRPDLRNVRRGRYTTRYGYDFLYYERTDGSRDHRWR